MYYFAYDLNLNKKQMLELCPDSKPRFTATLHHYKLVFVGWSRKWRGGIASIKPFRGERVDGTIYEISERDLRQLDRYQGYPSDYTRINIKVNTDVAELAEAITYVKSRGAEEETRPSAEYLAIIRQGYRDWGIE